MWFSQSVSFYSEWLKYLPHVEMHPEGYDKVPPRCTCHALFKISAFPVRLPSLPLALFHVYSAIFQKSHSLFLQQSTLRLLSAKDMVWCYIPHPVNYPVTGKASPCRYFTHDITNHPRCMRYPGHQSNLPIGGNTDIWNIGYYFIILWYKFIWFIVLSLWILPDWFLMVSASYANAAVHSILEALPLASMRPLSDKQQPPG